MKMLTQKGMTAGAMRKSANKLAQKIKKSNRKLVSRTK